MHIIGKRNDEKNIYMAMVGVSGMFDIITLPADAFA